MLEQAKVGVRYCGGCNPRYDRVAMAGRLEGALPEAAFVPAEDGVPYAAALVVCGCTARCADVAGLAVPEARRVYTSGGADLLPAQEKLRKILQGLEARSLTHEQVLEILPHRAPMLLIDTVGRLVPGVEAAASLYADPDWAVFQGHFPGAPVLPGVYAVEAIAQAADLLLLTQARYAGKEPLFAGINRARFRTKIAPGDTLDIQVSLLSERAELGMATCRGQIFCNGALAVEAEVTIALR